MSFVALHELLPDVAERETRGINVLPISKAGVPPGDYQFNEMFCDEADCDCRRVFFMVSCSTQKEIQAVIAWGWENEAFYKRWFGSDDADMVSEMQGPVLNLASAQSKNAKALLELAKKLLLADPAYVERVKRHYALFRAKIDERDKAKKAAKKLLRKSGTGSPKKNRRGTPGT